MHQSAILSYTHRPPKKRMRTLSYRPCSNATCYLGHLLKAAPWLAISPLRSIGFVTIYLGTLQTFRCLQEEQTNTAYQVQMFTRVLLNVNPTLVCSNPPPPPLLTERGELSRVALTYRVHSLMFASADRAWYMCARLSSITTTHCCASAFRFSHAMSHGRQDVVQVFAKVYALRSKETHLNLGERKRISTACR